MWYYNGTRSGSAFGRCLIAACNAKSPPAYVWYYKFTMTSVARTRPLLSSRAPRLCFILSRRHCAAHARCLAASSALRERSRVPRCRRKAAHVAAFASACAQSAASPAACRGAAATALSCCSSRARCARSRTCHWSGAHASAVDCFFLTSFVQGCSPTPRRPLCSCGGGCYVAPLAC